MRKKSDNIMKFERKLADLIYSYYIQGNTYDTKKSAEAIEAIANMLITIMAYDLNIRSQIIEKGEVIKHLDRYFKKAIMGLVNQKDDLYKFLEKEHKKNFQN